MAEHPEGLEEAGDVAVRTDPYDRDLMLEDVLEGLRLPQPELSPKYFYDTRGSELFEEITRLEEYYLTRKERALLERWIPRWVAEIGPVALVELGAGSAAKSRIVLDAMAAGGGEALYVPVDVSGEFLHETARRLRAEYEGLTVAPEVADMSEGLDPELELPSPAWVALLGSTIGNFDPDGAERLLSRIADRLNPADRFLMGVDLRPGPGKSVERLERAYDDARGVTAEFNLNVLSVLNRELGTDFEPGAFRHLSFYEPRHARIEMHLVSERDQTVTFPGGEAVRLEKGDTIRTEISCKHDRASVERMFARAGLAVDRWAEDPEGYFALVLGRPA